MRENMEEQTSVFETIIRNLCHGDNNTVELK